MTGKIIAPLVLALALGALPASASHRTGDDDDRRTTASRGFHRYEGGIRHDREPWRVRRARHEERIGKLAARLDAATSELSSAAARRGRPRTHREWRALHSLRRLERRAENYRFQVARRGAGSRSAAHAWRGVERAYRHADACRRDLRRSRRVRGQFERVDALIGRLDRRIAKLEELPRRRRHASHREDARPGGSRGWPHHVAFHFRF